jgi:hypothetical protein
MTCLTSPQSFHSSDNFTVIFSLNKLQSNSSTTLQFSVGLPTPVNTDPEKADNLQELTTVLAASGIVVSFIVVLFQV